MADASLSYPYALKSIQADRALYMYSPLGGREFIRSYLDSRNRTVQRLHDACGTGHAPERHPSSPAIIPPGQADIVTKQMAEDCLHGIEQGNIAPQIGMWSEFFVRKFETARKLSAGYSLALRGSNEEADLATYSIVAHFVSRTANASAPDGIRFLNGLLKLNDFISFRLQLEPITAVIAHHALAAMKTETQLIGDASA